MSYPNKLLDNVVGKLQVLRNHWKKSTFAVVAATYAVSATREYVLTQQLMREYCAKASLYGNAPLPPDAQPRTVTVILNPNANKRKALKQFEKYCAPILHLSGMYVDVLQTDSEGHARTLVKSLSNSDAIVVAGGDGTLSEVVTGLLRNKRKDPDNLLPIGVLPLGRSNTVASRFFPGGKSVENVRSLAEASFAIVQGYTKPVDVMKIEVLDERKSAQEKPVYALSGLEWGAFRDAHSKRDNYWYLGPLRSYATYVFNGFKSNLCWNCEAVVNYNPPCSGCSNCTKPKPLSNDRKWYRRFTPRPIEKPLVDYSLIVNERCSETLQKKIRTSDFVLKGGDFREEEPARLALAVGPKKLGYFDFVRRGWQMERGSDRGVKRVIEARQVEIHPVNLNRDMESMYSIDSEEYDAKPVRVTILPKIVNMFVKIEPKAR